MSNEGKITHKNGGNDRGRGNCMKCYFTQTQYQDFLSDLCMKIKKMVLVTILVFNNSHSMFTVLSR